jgi:hypothetical protein
MKTRILNNDLFGGTYTSDFLEKNKNNIINGSLVSTWNLTDEVCSINLIIPIFQNGNWIESATAEEIKSYQNIDFKINRDLLLENGVSVTFNSNEYWFNEKALSDFISLINVFEKSNLNSIEWKTKLNNWVIISVTDAYKISFLATKEIQKIYKG